MATDISPTDPTGRPMRPQGDIERIHRLLDSKRFGDFAQGGELPPMPQYMVLNGAADALAWALHLDDGIAFGLYVSDLVAAGGVAAELQEPMIAGVELIAQERRRQVETEGYTPEHDDQHNGDELSIAAACFAVEGLDCFVATKESGDDAFPWTVDDIKRQSHSRMRRLAIAGALIAAEIDRLLRAGETPV